jgi:S1-C subfamily serine protease
MKLFIFILLVFAGEAARSQQDTTGPVDSRAIKTVIQIVNDSGRGSGFLVKAGGRVFLVTNKHMIADWSPIEAVKVFDSILVTFYAKNPHNPTYTIPIFLKKDGKILSTVLIHPNQKIDVAIIDVTNQQVPDTDNTSRIDTSRFITMKNASGFLTYGSQVFAIGYPAGIKSFKTNEPIVKSSFLASSMDETLVVQQFWKNKKGKLVSVLSEGKIFLIDGAIIPGNSGGPVLTSQSVVWREINGQVQYLKDSYNRVVGIVSNSFSGAGITTVFSSEHILELIRSYKP